MVKVFEKGYELKLEDLETGGAFLVDKDLDWTSFDVVKKVRYALKRALSKKKVKVGHAGTLDPRATGLLILCYGKATKQIDSFQNLDKEYTGEFTLGGTTPSYDTETEVDHEYSVDHIDKDQLYQKTNEFIGEIDQLPPIFSALKKDGVPLYKRARRGEVVEVEPRKIRINSFDIEHIDMPKVSFRVGCGKGTYIRSLAYDYGKALDSGAYLSSLCRTKIGDYSVDNCWNVLDLCAQINKCNSES